MKIEKLKVIPVREFYIDPTWDALEPKWWHKIIFWKKWKYPEYILTREWKTLKEML